LQGVKLLSLALNLPGPAALMRCRAMGASCHKIEPPAPPGSDSGDPMRQYCPLAYAALHAGVRVSVADLKTPAGQLALHQALASTDVLLTSFRPAALHKLGLGWDALQAQYPRLSQVAIVGAAGARAAEAGHDLTYLAERGRVTGLDLPVTLYADMGGSLMVSEAILQAVLSQKLHDNAEGSHQEIALSDAAGYLALPRSWGLTQPGPRSVVGGAHAGYRVYPCADGRVAVAALEPHFAAALCQLVGLPLQDAASAAALVELMLSAAAHQAIAAFMQQQSCHQLDALAAQHDLPLHSLPNPVG
jgi:crotonobetainyl-CoA:carnitine CoA-transferase CaiB-like acyl-CoA transferase